MYIIYIYTQTHIHKTQSCVISGFRRELDDTCVLLSYYASSSGNFLPTFRDNLSFSSFGVEKPKDLLDS